MITFSKYFNQFKDMMLNDNIPIEFRAMFITNKCFASSWKKMHKYHILEDSVISDAAKWDYDLYKRTFPHHLRKTTIKNIESLIDMDLHHPELSTTDLIISLILWGREPQLSRR